MDSVELQRYNRMVVFLKSVSVHLEEGASILKLFSNDKDYKDLSYIIDTPAHNLDKLIYDIQDIITMLEAKVRYYNQRNQK